MNKASPYGRKNAMHYLNHLSLPPIKDPLEIKPIYIHRLVKEQLTSGLFIHHFHSHDFVEIHIPSTTTVYVFEDHSVTVEKNQFIMIFPHVKHHFSEDILKYPTYGLAVSLPAKNHSDNKYNVMINNIMSKNSYFVGNLNSAIKKTLDACIDCCINPTFFTPYQISYMVSGIVLEMFLMSSDDHDLFSHNEKYVDQRLVGAKKYISDNISQNITCEDIANHVFLSNKQLTRLFLKYEGKNTKRYIEEYRFEQARRLITETDLSLKEISSSLGFETESYFNTVFKRLSGYPPKKFRSLYGKYN